MANEYEVTKKEDYPTWTSGSPQHGKKKSGFANFIWNPDTKEFLGRTGISWLKITIFYLCFYAGLGLFFMTSLKIALVINVADDRPKWTLDNSLIGDNPGIGFRPMPDQDKNEGSTLIWINRETEKDESYWADELKNFIKVYSDSEDGKKCDYDNPADSETACIVNVEKMLECNHTSNYGYTSGAQNLVKPCVLVKLNRIYNWTPDPYTTREDLTIAEERGMPTELLDRINQLINDVENHNDSRAANELKTVWVSCDGENPADVENIGKRKYFSPGMDKEFPGIPNYYFPYLNQGGYMSPFVFAQFENPQDHTLINVRCQAWAKNIIADKLDRKGMVHFEFLID